MNEFFQRLKQRKLVLWAVALQPAVAEEGVRAKPGAPCWCQC